MTRNIKSSQRPFIMPIFVPHLGCPHQCVFCNQSSITGSNSKASPGSITEIINDLSEKVTLHCSELLFPVFQGPLNDQLRAQRGRARRREVAFYGGSFTGMDKKVQIQLLSAIQHLIRKGLIDSIRVSTRPDYIDPQTLHLLREHGVKTVELGVQSMVEEVLRCSRRGHTAEDVLKAAGLLHGGGFELGIQIMVGLPGDDALRNGHTVDRVIRLNPHFVRIYPTLVLKGTHLEKWYHSDRYTPLSLKEAVELCKRAFLKFHRAGIPVIRLGLQSSPELETKGCIVAGPYHPAFGHVVESSLFYDMASHLMGKRLKSRILRAKVSPSDLSNIRGQKNENLSQLKQRFGLLDIQIEVDEEQPRGSLILINGTKLNEVSYRTLPFS
ncbi:MAG: radical SAM protein [Syntrophobacterales bacterium]|nr:MAG: radical SAM protein [Syntrophobacterales bacterium]